MCVVSGYIIDIDSGLRLASDGLFWPLEVGMELELKEGGPVYEICHLRLALWAVDGPFSDWEHVIVFVRKKEGAMNWKASG